MRGTHSIVEEDSLHRASVLGAVASVVIQLRARRPLRLAAALIEMRDRNKLQVGRGPRPRPPNLHLNDVLINSLAGLYKFNARLL